jgi:serine/threonine-protein kinase
MVSTLYNGERGQFPGEFAMQPRGWQSGTLLSVAIAILAVTGRHAESDDAQAPPNADLAAQAKELFRAHCFACHGGAKTNAGIKILDRTLLVDKKKKVAPGNPEGSELYRLMTAQDESVMPPPSQPRLRLEEIDLIRRWIAAGAPAFPADLAAPVEEKKDALFKDLVGVDFVLKRILEHVRTVPSDERRFIRYFSINHILTGGATPAELQLHRDALAKAINHLTWESQPVPLQAIDPVGSVFAVDLRKLGWDQKPFERWLDGQAIGRSEFNFFDLALLEYPYGIHYQDSETFNQIAEEFLLAANQVRPIAYVRADWFASLATQTPLYEDFLRLPLQLKQLEAQLGVDAEADVENFRAKRAGMIVSGVSRNNRVVERHPFKHGAYWKSFDFRTGKGPENIFADPINLNPTAGEFIFNLPNGLQGYFIANGKGERVEAAPTDIVTDKFAEDKTVRNGLACLRCHDRGMKAFKDTVRPAVERMPGTPGFDKQLARKLYPEEKEMDDLVQADEKRFLEALAKVLGKPPAGEPLVPVSHRYLDEPLTLASAAGELGLAKSDGLSFLFRSPQFAALGLMPLAADGGVVRRDAWEDYFDQVVRGLGIGIPLPPLDGVTRPDFAAGPVGQTFLSAGRQESVPKVEFKPNNTVFKPGDTLIIEVANKGARPIHVELIGTGVQGRKYLLAPAGTLVAPGKTYQYRTEVKPKLGKEFITLLASETPFPPGEVLRGRGVTDRVVHSFFQLERRGGRLILTNDAAPVVKKTITIETR